ncbi:plasmid replication initiator [Gluconobacter oxydans]|uniref:Plasmid replication initiator n=3 Tax=Acetobacteraceae TaxID=433 RepID=A0A149S720_GLUOY|nr:plasmid replication initiator [Gluconobacter oxydans]KXV30662.1 plasmid replication initiator [Gluconobacter japonicus]
MMQTLHKILQDNGRQAALQLDIDRQVVEAAAAYMADEQNGVGFLYSGWCQAALPHRRLADHKGWQLESDQVCLIIEPGMKRGAAGEPVPVGVPYGSRARLILIYLQSEAIRTNSRDIELGKSLRAWMGRMNIPIGGKNLQIVRDQMERISRSRLSFEVKRGGTVGLTNQNIMDSAVFMDPSAEGDNETYMHMARLSEGFFDGLRRHPVPLDEAAIRALSNNSMALDIYSWLAYRLHSLSRPTSITWHGLKAQFGLNFGQLKNFKARFLPNLQLALAVYPAAKVLEQDDGKGIILYPGQPPVGKKAISLKL